MTHTEEPIPPDEQLALNTSDFSSLDQGIERLAMLRSRLRFYSLSAEALGNIRPEDRENILLDLLADADTAHRLLRGLLPPS